MKWIASCPICSYSGFDPYLTCLDFVATYEKFQLARCLNCGLLMTNPRPDDEALNRYYQSDAYVPHRQNSQSILAFLYRTARRSTLRWKASLAKPYRGQGRLLDYGCGTGEFMTLMARRGWETWGLENNAEARARAQSLSKTIVYDTEDATKGEFDLVTLWHVLEHLPQPGLTLEFLHSRLAPNGTLFIAVPNHNSFDSIHYKEHWAGYDVPRHLWHFSRSNVVDLLQRHNFTVIKTVPMVLDAFYVSLLSEKYLGHSFIRRYFSSLKIAQGSNRRARQSGEYSSILYIAQPRQA